MSYNQDTVERIAQAIYESREKRRIQSFVDKSFPWDAAKEVVRDSYRDDARAALDEIDSLYSEDEGNGS
jgi:hypothetical protein